MKLKIFCKGCHQEGVFSFVLENPDFQNGLKKREFDHYAREQQPSYILSSFPPFLLPRAFIETNLSFVCFSFEKSWKTQVRSKTTWYNGCNPSCSSYMPVLWFWDQSWDLSVHNILINWKVLFEKFKTFNCEKCRELKSQVPKASTVISICRIISSISSALLLPPFMVLCFFGKEYFEEKPSPHAVSLLDFIIYLTQNLNISSLLPMPPLTPLGNNDQQYRNI